MKLYLKVLHVLSWILIGLLFTFPMLLLWPFINVPWYIDLLPCGLFFIGLVVVPIGLLFGEDSDDWPRILWLWGNDEEEPPEWWRLEKFANFRWYAIRNPVNNSRFLLQDYDPDDVNVETNWQYSVVGGEVLPMEAQHMLDAGQAVAWRWLWSGPFAGYRRVWLNGQDKYSEIWFGWKLGSKVPGLGFTGQVRPKRKIGT